MKLLAIDTSTMLASAAVIDADETGIRVLAAQDSGVSTHSENLLGLVSSVFATAGVALADMEAIAVGAGPGSFTGLRIGLATAKGLAYATAKPLWLSSSLAALATDRIARGGVDERLVVAVSDARRNEVFVGCYHASCAGDDGVAVAVAVECVMAPEAVAEAIANPEWRPVVIVGDGAATYAEVLGAAGEIDLEARPTPSAVSVAKLALAGDRVDSLHLGAPAYIRLSEAEIRFPNGNPGGTFAAKPRT